MREIEKSYNGRESPEWRGRLVKLLSQAIYEYLKSEGLLRRDEKLSDHAKLALKQAHELMEKGREWEAENIAHNA